MPTFAIGEVAIVHRPGTACHGLEVTVLSALRVSHWRDSRGFHGESAVYDVSDPYNGVRGRPANGGNYVLEPHELRKKRPPPERQQTVSWGECPWQPEKLKEVSA